MGKYRFTPTLLEIKKDSLSDTGFFTGYASTFGLPADSVGDVISAGAFAHTLLEHKAKGTVPSMFWHHDASEPIGRWLELEEDNRGLLAHGKLTLGTRRGAEAFELMKDDAVGLSIGFVMAGGNARKNNKGRTITRLGKLHEISIVSVPAQSRAKILETRSLRPATIREFQSLLQSAGGLSVNESKRVCKGGWNSLVRDERDTQLSSILSEIQALRADINRTR